MKLFLPHFFSLLLVSLPYSWCFALPEPIIEKAHELKIPTEHFSLVVQDVHSSQPRISHHAHTPRTPASVVKVLTTYAALLELGERYRWPTQFFATGKIQGDTLHGDLIVKAQGDPSLVTEDLLPIIHGLRARGIRHISGDLIVDQGYFKHNLPHWSGFDDNNFSPYNAMPAALMFNHRANKIDIVTDRKKNKAYTRRTFPDYSFKIINQLQVENVRCHGKHAWPDVDIHHDGKRSVVKFFGLYSSRCPDRKIRQVLTMPAYTFFAALKHTLKQHQGSIKGNVRFARTPAKSTLIYTHYSKPLIDIIATINKKSNNVMARNVLLTLAAKKYGGPATRQNGVKAAKAILQHHQLIDAHTHFSNGSGLSRTATLTAHTLTRILRHGYHGPHPWMNTLAVMGTDGTLKRRLLKSPVQGKAWMKTGSIKGVRSITGYVRAASGNTYMFTHLINHPRAKWPGGKLQDFILEWVAKNY